MHKKGSTYKTKSIQPQHSLNIRHSCRFSRGAEGGENTIQDSAITDLDSSSFLVSPAATGTAASVCSQLSLKRGCSSRRDSASAASAFMKEATKNLKEIEDQASSYLTCTYDAADGMSQRCEHLYHANRKTFSLFYLPPSRSIRWPCLIVINELTFWSALETLVSCYKCDHM